MIDRPAPMGRVMTHEIIILPTTERSIADNPLAKPTPKTAPTRVCVVDIGSPVPEARTTVVIASGTGLPISTTHTLVGAVLGVGLARGLSAIDLGVVGRIVISWVITLPVGAGLSILFFFTLKGIFS